MSNARPHLLTIVDKVDARTAATATVILWCAALYLYASELLPQLPDAPLATFDVTEVMLLALACLGFQLSTLRIGLDDIAHIWQATIDPTHSANPARWRTFGWIGATCWLLALAVGIPAAMHLWLTNSTMLIFALVIILIPAVQCTGAAVIGPILTHAIEERETAQAARRVILEVALSARERSQREV